MRLRSGREEKWMANEMIPDELNAKGVFLRDTGVSQWVYSDEYAWKYSAAMEVIDFLDRNGYVVLGGHVLGSDLRYEGSQWDYRYQEHQPMSSNIHESARQAYGYLEWFFRNLGDDYHYTITAVTQERYRQLLEEEIILVLPK